MNFMVKPFRILTVEIIKELRGIRPTVLQRFE